MAITSSNQSMNFNYLNIIKIKRLLIFSYFSVTDWKFDFVTQHPMMNQETARSTCKSSYWTFGKAMIIAKMTVTNFLMTHPGTISIAPVAPNAIVLWNLRGTGWFLLAAINFTANASIPIKVVDVAQMQMVGFLVKLIALSKALPLKGKFISQRIVTQAIFPRR